MVDINQDSIITGIKKLKSKIKTKVNIHIDEDIYNNMTNKIINDLKKSISDVVGSKITINIVPKKHTTKQKIALVKLAIELEKKKQLPNQQKLEQLLAKLNELD